MLIVAMSYLAIVTMSYLVRSRCPYCEIYLVTAQSPPIVKWVSHTKSIPLGEIGLLILPVIERGDMPVVIQRMEIRTAGITQ